MSCIENNNKYNEIESFFNEYFKLTTERYEKNFLQYTLSEYTYECHNIVLSNYSDLRYPNIHNLALYFSHNYVYYIFKEIKKLLINKIYLVDIDNVNNIIYDGNDEIKRINNKIINSLYIFSINNLIFEIFSKYNNNYKKFIEENNEYNNFINKYENIINKFEFCNLLRINNYQQKLDFSINNIQNYLLYNFYDKNFSYINYLEIYNFLQSYYTNLNDIEELISTKQISKKKDIKLDKIKIEKVKIEKIKKKSIPVTLKRNVWNKHIGEAIGKTLCLCCKLTEITQLNFSCGHIISEFNGGQLKLDNLKPICVSCNSSVGTKNMDQYIEEYGL